MHSNLHMFSHVFFAYCMKMVGKRKHRSCTLKHKLEVLKRLHKAKSGMKLAVEFGVVKATISDWKKNRSMEEKQVQD
ncbi:MAG: hypothetical protein ACTS8Y_03315 [Arsenophonus sp. ER-EMS1-MAG3]